MDGEGEGSETDMEVGDKGTDNSMHRSALGLSTNSKLNNTEERMKEWEKNNSSCISQDPSQINEGENDGSGGPLGGGKIYWKKPEVIIMGNDEFARDTQKTHEKYLREMEITGLKLELTELESDENLEKLKKNMRLYFPSLMASIVEILLYK